MKRYLMLALIAGSALAGCASKPMTWNSESAGKYLLDRFERMRARDLLDGADLREMPLTATPLRHVWAFAVVKRKADGGPPLRAMFLVGPTPEGFGGGGYVAAPTEFADVFRMKFASPAPIGAPPKSAAEAAAIAHAYAWLFAVQRPETMEVLTSERAKELAGEEVAAAVFPERVTAHKLWLAGVTDTVYTVEFCTLNPDQQSAIIAWHAVIGPFNFAVSWRAIRMPMPTMTGAPATPAPAER